MNEKRRIENEEEENGGGECYYIFTVYVSLHLYFKHLDWQKPVVFFVSHYF